MSTPNNQPRPPAGMPMNMRLATEEDRKGVVPVGAMCAFRYREDGHESRWELSWNVGKPFQQSDRNCEYFYAIPITPSVPATGDTTNEKGGAVIHELKTWPEYYDAILRGEKTFEIRKNDRNFQVGDTLVLRRFDPKTGEYTGAKHACAVTYLTEWDQKPGNIVMAIKPL